VVARFDKTETVMGPFTASETVTIAAAKGRTGFLPSSQKHGRTKDAFGEGEQLIVEGKTATLTKMVTVTVYDDFPATGSSRSSTPIPGRPTTRTP
jgi:alpha-galactosidase